MTSNTQYVSSLSAELITAFKALDTASVSDALDKCGINGQAQHIMPLANYPSTVVGPAFTVKYVPAGKPAGTVGDYIDDVPPGAVVVIDNEGRTDCTVWGDILTQYAGLKSIAGTVIHGVCRDVTKALLDDYPIFSTGRFMRTGKDRVEVASVNETVSIGAVKVCASDIVVADASGVVFVPLQHAQEVLEIAQDIERVEAAIREKIESGSRIKEARQSLGYHQLQTRR